MGSESIPRRAYKVSELAEMWGVSRWSIYELIDSGALKYLKVNSMKVIPADEVKAYEERMTQRDGAA